jgi:Domain of unknown function (DUF4440)
MKIPKLAALVVLVGMSSLLASPQDQEKDHKVVPNAKLQIFFSELETQWLKAAQDKDPAAFNRIVSDDFHLWAPAAPGKPIARADWLAGVFGRRLLSFQVRQLAVRELSPTIAVVSFVQTDTFQQSATPQTEDHFVVDVWTNSGGGDNWRCTDRYLSEAKRSPTQK